MVTLAASGYKMCVSPDTYNIVKSWFKDIPTWGSWYFAILFVSMYLVTSYSEVEEERANVHFQGCYRVMRSGISLPISAVQGAPALLDLGIDLLRFQI